MQLKPVHAGIGVQDMEQALEWYQRNLGFELVKDDGFIPPIGARVCFVRNGDFELELFEHQNAGTIAAEEQRRLLANQTLGTKHIAFEVSDMEAAKEKLSANDVEIVMEKTMYNQRVMFIRDCCGTQIELIQRL